MTVIAYDGKILAADKQRTHVGLKSSTNKIIKLKNGFAVGTGVSQQIIAMVEWYKAGSKIDKFPFPKTNDDYAVLIVFSKNKIMEYDNSPYPFDRTDKIMAWGSGRDYAIGAMAAGKNAIEAVEITSKYCAECGLGIDSVEIQCKHS